MASHFVDINTCSVECMNKWVIISICIPYVSVYVHVYAV